MNSLRVLALGLALAAGAAQAGVAVQGSRTAFEAQGTVHANYGFEDHGPGYTFVGDPYTSHGVRYETGKNIVVGPNAAEMPLSNVLTYTFWTPVMGTILPGTSPIDMFGLDLSHLGAFSTFAFTVTTNVGSYTLNNLSVPLASVGSQFFGFVADPGEVFTSFNLASSVSTGSAPTIDNVTLGTFGVTAGPAPSVVPAPASLALSALALGLGTALRRRGQRDRP